MGTVCTYMYNQLFICSTKTAELPVFTICPQYKKGYKKQLLKEKYKWDVSDIIKFNFPNEVENTRDFFYEVTYSISEFIKVVEIKSHESEVLKLAISNKGIQGSDGAFYKHEEFFSNATWINFGLCFTMKVPKLLKDHFVRNPSMYDLTQN